jgi:hypothetical protein
MSHNSGFYKSERTVDWTMKVPICGTRHWFSATTLWLAPAWQILQLRGELCCRLAAGAATSEYRDKVRLWLGSAKKAAGSSC